MTTDPFTTRAGEARGPRYPLSVRLPRGRVRHLARMVSTGTVATACGKRSRNALLGVSDRPICAACMAKPNPIDCRSYPTVAPDTAMDEFEAADDIYGRWE